MTKIDCVSCPDCRTRRQRIPPTSRDGNGSRPRDITLCILIMVRKNTCRCTRFSQEQKHYIIFHFTSRVGLHLTRDFKNDITINLLQRSHARQTGAVVVKECVWRVWRVRIERVEKDWCTKVKKIIWVLISKDRRGHQFV